MAGPKQGVGSESRARDESAPDQQNSSLGSTDSRRFNVSSGGAVGPARASLSQVLYLGEDEGS